MNNISNKSVLNRVCIFYLCLFSVLSLPAHALGKTDRLNKSEPSVKVIKKYPGTWKGWADGCINCNKPLAPERVYTRKKKKAKSASKQKTEGGGDKKVVSSGFCECNCSATTADPRQEIFQLKSPQGFEKKDFNKALDKAVDKVEAEGGEEAIRTQKTPL